MNPAFRPKTRILATILPAVGILAASLACTATYQVGQMTPEAGQMASVYKTPENYTAFREVYTVTPTPESTPEIVTVRADAFLRAAPETSGRILAVLRVGDAIRVLARESGWLLADADGIIGWLWAGCIVGGESCR